MADSVRESGAAARGKMSPLLVSRLTTRKAAYPKSHASRRIAKQRDFMRNRTRPITKSRISLAGRSAWEGNGDDGEDLHVMEEKGEKSDSRVRFLVKVCARELGGRCLSAFPPIIPSSTREDKADRKYVQYVKAPILAQPSQLG